ncbi:hypothetical protein AB3N04_06805 [Alkalihalophilus sp. As8PL]|uniref:Uncharacterized protein n=1 Tax=Alkalihalophilus sp. As8PL TaxID=3237103 RepID=A0AB39BWE4_9BACI
MSHLVDKITAFSNTIRNEFHKHFPTEKTHKINIQELAYSIRKHPDAKKKSNEWLGLVLNEYRLSVGLIDFTLETKGHNDEKLIKVSATEKGVDLFSYASYDDKQAVTDDHALPQYAYEFLTKA